MANGDPTPAAYQDLRDHIQSEWDHVELVDQDGDAILRITTSDPRLVWFNAAGAQLLSLRGVFKGSDADIAPKMPVTVAGSRVFKGPTGGSAMLEHDFEYVQVLAESRDQVTVEHFIEVPATTPVA